MFKKVQLPGDCHDENVHVYVTVKVFASLDYKITGLPGQKWNQRDPDLVYKQNF